MFLRSNRLIQVRRVRILFLFQYTFISHRFSFSDFRSQNESFGFDRTFLVATDMAMADILGDDCGCGGTKTTRFRSGRYVLSFQGGTRKIASNSTKHRLHAKKKPTLHAQWRRSGPISVIRSFKETISYFRVCFVSIRHIPSMVEGSVRHTKIPRLRYKPILIAKRKLSRPFPILKTCSCNA